jgi:hypothetical protein
LCALCLGLSALKMLPGLLIAGEHLSQGHTYGFFFFTLNAVVAISLWFFPGLAARRLISDPMEPGEPASADTWLAMGCALIGLWILTYALPALIRDTFVLQSAESVYSDASALKSWVLYNLLQVAIALWLIFGGAGFRQLFWWARGAGLGRPSSK